MNFDLDLHKFDLKKTTTKQTHGSGSFELPNKVCTYLFPITLNIGIQLVVNSVLEKRNIEFSFDQLTR